MSAIPFLLWAASLIFPAILAAQDRYVVSYGGFGGYQVPIWVTKELGLLERIVSRAKNAKGAKMTG